MTAFVRHGGRVLARRFAGVLAVLVLAGVAFTAAGTGAQTAPAKKRGRPTRAHRVADGGAPLDAAAPPPAREAKSEAGTGAVVSQKTLDGGTTVLRFGELDIEGRLKNPQLVFFLRRVRAEFAAGDLGHRSFLRELGETKQDPNF